MNVTSVLRDRQASRRPSLFEGELVRIAFFRSFAMLNPKIMMRNPVMFVTEIGALLTTLTFVMDALGSSPSMAYTLAVTVILWATVLFANFAEALAEARGKAQANTLKRTRSKTVAKKLVDGKPVEVMSDMLKQGDLVVVSRWGIYAPPTAKWWKARPAWMNPPSPANPRRWCARQAAISAL